MTLKSAADATATMPFLADDEMSQRIRGFPWSTTGLGDIGGWPASLKTLVGTIVRATVPMVALCGEDGVLIYNAPYAVICGERHPAALGGKLHVIWPEAEAFNRVMMADVLGGKSLTYRDLELMFYRQGVPTKVWLDLNYSPILDDAGTPMGVLAIVVENTARVLQERRRADEGERLARLFAQAPSFMTLLSGPLHRFDFANPKYIELVGGRDIIGRPIAEALPETVEQGFVALLDQVYATGQAFSAVGAKVTLTQPAGAQDRYVDFVYQPITNDDGEVTGIFVEGMDVTDRVLASRTGEVLAKLSERFDGLATPAQVGAAAAEVIGVALQASRSGYAVVEPGREVVRVESAWHAPGAVPFAGSVRLRDYAALFDSLDRGELVAIADVRADPRTVGMAQALEARGARAFVSQPVIEQGQLVAIFSVHSAHVRQWSRDDIGLLREVTARTRSASERLRVAEDLRQANETLQHRFAEAIAERRILADIVEGTNAFVQVADLDYRWLAINRASADEFERIFGVRPQVGQSMLDMLAHLPDQQAAVRAVWVRALAGEAFTQVQEFGDAGRDRRSYEMRFNPLYDARGQRVGAFQFVFDVTERLHEQARLAQAEEQLRQSQKMEAVGQLTGGLAHDFNNLLAGIMGNLELLERRIAAGNYTGTERYIEAAQGASRRAAALTQRLLAFSRRQTLDPRPLDINRLVAGMDELIRRSVGPNIEVEVVGAGGLWLTRADASQLENSLLNLCLNARDAMSPKGGRLTIETANRWLDERGARERELLPGQYVSLCVTDTGSGMSAETIGRAFDPFFTTKPLGEGTGLGLSMVHGFVRQSGGQVRIYSEIGKGTTMCLYLPRFIGELDAAEVDEPARVDPGDGETVLVVDDEPTLRSLIAEVLLESGYTVLQAVDGASALAILQSDLRIDLLLTDVGLPGGLNGRQVADAARGRRPGLKVLFITGFAENAVVGNGHLDAGMAILTKPFPVAVLTARVRDLIDHG